MGGVALSSDDHVPNTKQVVLSTSMILSRSVYTVLYNIYIVNITIVALFIAFYCYNMYVYIYIFDYNMLPVP